MTKVKEEIKLHNFSSEKLIETIKNFSDKKITVVGDIILDEFLLGTPERISREAPVIILDYLKSDYTLGGAGNAAANLASLGAKVTLIGICGEDENQEKIQEICNKLGIELVAISEAGRKSTVKTRIISTSNSNPDAGTGLKQQVLRLDKQSKHQCSEETKNKIIESFKEVISSSELCLLSDYNNGLFDTELSQKLIEICNSLDKKSIVDSNSGFKKFKSAFSMTPNQPDAEKILGYQIKEENLEQAAKETLAITQCSEILLTRGAKGMLLYSSEKGLESIPAFNLSEVFDVTGAGDTVAATYCLGLSTGSSSLEAAVLGNLAASLVVKKYGTACINQEELIEAIST